MKILLFDKAYETSVDTFNPCRKCVLNKGKTCSKIPAAFCREYGGFRSSDTKIFTL